MDQQPTGKQHLLDFQRLRKLTRQGSSYAISIPAVWVHAVCDPRLPYVTTTPDPSGAIIVRPFRMGDDLSRP